MSRRQTVAGLGVAAVGATIGIDPARANPASVKPVEPKPFQVAVPQSRLDEILARVAAFRWDALADPADGGDWRYGPPGGYMRDLCAYWTGGYDWRAHERAMNAVPQFYAEIDGTGLHFVHVRGSGASPRPLLIVPGWPYSFHSYSALIDRLTQPERFGGRTEDAFSVVIPSLPGFAFSDRPAHPMGPRPIAALLDRLMVEMLGYERYIVHGGDWGAAIADILGYFHPEHVVGIHLAMVFVRADGAPALSGQTGPTSTEAEGVFAAHEAVVWNREGAYAQLESTKPLKLAYAMADSPVGIAAWIVEAFHAWSDRRERSFDTLITRDQLLTEVMLYLVTDAFSTSVWIDAAAEPDHFLTVPPGRRIEVPVGVAAFPDPVFLPVPREIVERSHNVVHYTVMPRGGHFPFYEAPDLLIGDVRQFTRALNS